MGILRGVPPHGVPIRAIGIGRARAALVAVAGFALFALYNDAAPQATGETQGSATTHAEVGSVSSGHVETPDEVGSGLEETPATTAPSGSDVVGTWCDAIVPGSMNREMIIARRAGEGYELRERYTGGSSNTRALRMFDGRYWLIGDNFGGNYGVGAEGELRLYDRQGFIRVALPATRNCVR